MYQEDKYLQMGSFHTLHCEDAVFAAYLTVDVRLMVVMDGCSSGVDSQFGSTLGARIFRKIAAEMYLTDLETPDAASLKGLQEQVLRRFMEELKSACRQLELRWNEVLFTVVMAILNETTREAEVIALGDGVVACNGRLFRYDQFNRPDYPSYHLKDDFGDWYASQQQRLSFQGVKDLAISTDGVESLAPAREDDEVALSDEEVVQRILCGEGKIKAAVHALSIEHGLNPRDDLGIIRVQCN